MNINLNLPMKENPFVDMENEVLSLFYSSSTNQKSKVFRFAKLDSNFSAYLPYLKDGAIKLYLYYALAAKSDSGESWHSIDKISKSLNATDRSIGNWNNELEDLGLIYRTKCGRKSKTTFLLPLTGFAVKLSTKKIGQMLTELDLYNTNENSKVFGRFESLTKLYIVDESKGALYNVTAVHLKKTHRSGKQLLNSISVFLYDVSPVKEKALSDTIVTEGAKHKENVVLIKTKNEVSLGKRKLPGCNSFFINESHAFPIDDAVIYAIMSQLESNIDISVMPEMEIK